MLFELGLPRFNTLMDNLKFSFECSLLRCSNMIISSMLSKIVISLLDVISLLYCFYSFYWLFCCFLCVYVCLCVSEFSYGPMCLRQIK